MKIKYNNGITLIALVLTITVCYSKDSNITIQEGIKELGEYSFKQATNAQIINLPDSLEKIDSYMISGGGVPLQEINIGKNVSSIHYLFKGLNYNGIVNIDDENNYYKVENNILYKKDENGEPTTLVRVLYEINGTMQIKSTVKEIGRASFYGQRKMTEITIPEGVEIIIHNTEGSIQGAPWGAVKGMRVVQWVGK